MHLSPRILALAVIVLAGPTMGQGQCPTDYEEIEGECFRFVTGLETTWEQARTVCQDEGSDLAIIENCDVFSAVVRHIHLNDLEPATAFWIGGSDNGDAGDWSWIDDTQMELGVPFWGRGELLNNEPSGGETENCAVLADDDRFYFHDRNCDGTSYVGLCELIFHEPGTPCPDNFFAIDTNCFSVDRNTSGTWFDQRANCQSRGADLAVLDDCRIYGDLINFIHINGLDRFGSIWIGGTDLGNEGAWYWVNGDSIELGVPFWGRNGDGLNEPDDDGEEQNCASMWTDDRLTFHDDGCEESEGRSPLCHFGRTIPPV